MFRRYFDTLDRRGWFEFTLGIFLLALTFITAYVVWQTVLAFSFILSLIIVYKGVGKSLSVLFDAALCSIYRNKDGKNKEIYLRDKEFLDTRFEYLYGGGTCEEKEKK